MRLNKFLNIKISCLYILDSYEKGRKKAAKAEFTSNLDTDDDYSCRKRRTRKEVHSSSPDSTPPSKRHRQQSSKARYSRIKKIKPTVLFPIEKEPSMPLHQPNQPQSTP